MSRAREVRLYHRLQVAAHAVAKSSDRRMVDVVGLSTSQVAVLTVISVGTRVTQREVAAALGVNESAVTTMVRRLERLRCLTRDRDDTDGRAIVLTLTRDGRGVLERSRNAFALINESIERALSGDEIAAAASALGELTDAFDGPGIGPAEVLS